MDGVAAVMRILVGFVLNCSPVVDAVTVAVDLFDNIASAFNSITVTDGLLV